MPWIFLGKFTYKVSPNSMCNIYPDGMFVFPTPAIWPVPVVLAFPQEEWRSLLPFVTEPRFTVKWVPGLLNNNHNNNNNNNNNNRFAQIAPFSDHF